MAFIGLRHPVASPITEENEGSAVVYGTPFELEPAIAANVTWTRSSAVLKGNDIDQENDNGITGGAVSFNATDCTDEQQEGLLGTIKEGNTYVETDASAPLVGFGYVRVKKRRNVLRYIAYWIYKVQFALNSDEAKTKGESIEWQTPTLDGKIMGVFPDATGVTRFRAHETFTNYADAVAWVDAMSGTPMAQVATPTASPVAGAVASATAIALSSATSGATIYYTTDGSTPTTGSMIYAAGKIKVYAAMTVKAIAAKAGMSNSEVLSAAYTIA